MSEEKRKYETTMTMDGDKDAAFIFREDGYHFISRNILIDDPEKVPPHLLLAWAVYELLEDGSAQRNLVDMAKARLNQVRQQTTQH